MHPRSLRSSRDVCWRCQWCLARQRRGIGWPGFTPDGIASEPLSRLPKRTFHGTQLRTQIDNSPVASGPSFDPALVRPPRQAKDPIRQHLQIWQEQFGGPSEDSLKAFENHPARGDVHNSISKLSYGVKADEENDGNELDHEEGDEGDELITIGLFLKPGDVVELSQPGREPVLAVFVQQLDLMSQFYSVNGRWCHSMLSKISFAVPGCIDPMLLQPLVPFLPTKPGEASSKGDIQVPRDVGAPVQQLLERLTEDSEKIYRQNASVLDTAYSVLADPNRVRMMTLAQICKTLLGQNDPSWEPSPAALLAVRKALNHNEFRFRSDARSQRLTNVFAIRPRNDVQVVETVQKWIREYREFLAISTNVKSGTPRRRSRGATYVAEFIEKARRLISNSRKDREPQYGFVGPSKSRFPITGQSTATGVVWGETFTGMDSQIINFLQAWVLTRQFTNMPSLHSACASIIQATGCYEESHQRLPEPIMGRATGYLFLQEIGVITPHENHLLYDEQLMLPTVRLTRNLELLNTKAELTRRNPDFRDSMAELRKDWGKMSVYCIDAADAKEIDDGISITRILGKPQYWIHVHIANPTAFFEKTHVLSGLAAHMTETVYTPEQSFPMLPTWATQGYFSLDRNRPVITFSSRVDLSGNILETKIQPGIIRNVVSMTPTELTSALGEKPNFQVKQLVVGGNVPFTETSRPPPKLSSEQLRDLQDLYSIAKGLWKARKAAGGIRLSSGQNTVRLFESTSKSGLAWTPPSTDRARLIEGDPVIEFSWKNTPDSFQQEINASNIVEEIMILACHSVASWCANRNLPAMYRGTIKTPSNTAMSSEQVQGDVVDPYIEGHGSPSPLLGLQYINSLGRAIAHYSPLPHRIIGVPCYLKVTSPLRRFSDMIAHWQIEAVLRYEAQTGKKFDALEAAKASRPILPFSQKQMQESIVTLSPRERIISQTKRQSVHFWAILALMRAFYYKEANLPDTFRVWVKTAHDSGFGVTGLIGDLSINVHLVETPGVEFQAGDEWETAIHSIKVFNRRIYMRPVRLLHREAWQS